MRERNKRSESGSETDAATSSPSTSSWSSTSSGDSGRENNNGSVRKHGSSKRKRSISMNRGWEDSAPSSSSSSKSSDGDVKRRKSRLVRGRERRCSRKWDKSDREREREREKEKKREKKRRSSGSEKRGRKDKHRRKGRHDREKRKRKVSSIDPVAIKDDAPVQLVAKSTLQAVNEAQLQQKEIVRRNVEMAKARLASGELQRMKHEQMEMQRLYGTVDWREKKKLRAEKSRLERTIAAGKKLASIEERENARMDAFRIALGLPSAEAQRQAEWRAEATRALAAEAVNNDNLSPAVPSRSRKVIGPRLPH